MHIQRITSGSAKSDQMGSHFRSSLFGHRYRLGRFQLNGLWGKSGKTKGGKYNALESSSRHCFYTFSLAHRDTHHQRPAVEAQCPATFKTLNHIYDPVVEVGIAQCACKTKYQLHYWVHPVVKINQIFSKMRNIKINQSIIKLKIISNNYFLLLG